jgi:hypothetical protein
MNKSFYVLNGPNLNRLGKRGPEIYGATTLAEVEASCRIEAEDQAIEFRQTNSEARMIEWIHEAAQEVPGSDHRASYLEHSSSRTLLSSLLCLQSRDRGDCRPLYEWISHSCARAPQYDLRQRVVR